MKSDKIDVFGNTLLVSSSLPRLEFDVKSDKIDVFCNALLVSSSLPRVEFDVKIRYCLFFTVFRYVPEAGMKVNSIKATVCQTMYCLQRLIQPCSRSWN